MRDGDTYDFCGSCGTEFLQRAMRQVTASGIYLCLKCYDEDPLRGDDGLWIDDRDPDDYDPDGDYPDEPTGSCDWCGCNLYADDDWDGLCNSCSWHADQNRNGESDGIQPVT